MINRIQRLVKNHYTHTLLEHLADDAIAQLYVTIFSTIFLYLMKFYVTKTLAIASVTYSEIAADFWLRLVYFQGQYLHRWKQLNVSALKMSKQFCKFCKLESLENYDSGFCQMLQYNYHYIQFSVFTLLHTASGLLYVV